MRTPASSLWLLAALCGARADVVRTYGYCPEVSAAQFDRGFAACARLSLNYTRGDVLPLDNSVETTVTNAAATADCGLALPSLGSSPANLSCYIQVSIAPYVDVAERNLRFYECVDEAEDPRPARFESEMIAAIIVIGLIFLLPNAWLALVWPPTPWCPCWKGISLWPPHLSVLWPI